jgi:hypothetical protein
MESGQRPRTGIITDGVRWKVYHMEISQDFGIYFKEFTATNKNACFTILGTPFTLLLNLLIEIGMLSCMVAGDYPVSSIDHPTHPLLLVKYDKNYVEDEDTMMLE